VNFTHQHRILLITFLVLSTSVIDGQQNGQNSMTKVRNGWAQVDQLLDSAELYLDTEPQRSFDYVDRALEISISGRDPVNQARCYTMLGKVSYNLQQYDLAIGYYQKAILSLGSRSEELVNNIALLLGQSYEKTGDNKQSIDYYKKYLAYATENKLTREIISVRYDLARVYTSTGEDQKALREYDVIQKLEQKQNNPSGLVNVSTKQADIYLEQERKDDAIKSYKKAVGLAMESKDEDLQTNSLRNLSKAYRSNKQYDEELVTRKQSLEINKESNKLEEQAEDNLSIGEIYIEQDQPGEAVQYLQKSIDLSEQTGSYEKKSIALKTLSDAYKEQGAFDKALYAYKEYTTLVDSTYAKRERELRHNLAIVANINRKLQRIDLLEKDFELNRKTLELIQKEQDINLKELRTQKRLTYLLLLVLGVLLAASFFVFRSSIQKKKANLLLALRSLRSQMNPHFIFNSLNSVNSYIAQNNERMANKYLSEFSQLMRQVLENSKHDFVTVSSELEIIELYLKLEHSRFSDKFDYTIDIDKEINLNETMIPPMLIQPYIENAVWHGLRYKESKGILTVRLKREGDFFTAIITDNGIGRKQSQQHKTKHQKAGSSTAMKNTNNRLKIINEIYRTKYKVSIDDLNKEDSTGTVVELRIPIEQSESEGESE
jgi:tetratricopeptide (TPR) repeat protein